MAKFNIEIELDWLNEDYLDGEIKQEVIAGLQNTITHNVEKEIKGVMAERIEEEVGKVVDSFIKQLTNERLGSIQMPTTSSSWSSDVKYISLTEFIGKKFDSMMKEKTLTERGGRPSYRDDARYSVIEYLTKGYIANELNDKVSDMIQTAKTQAEESLVKNLEENLQRQLNADMVQKLNIPELLQNLQNTIDYSEVE